jgi:tyrosyl-tRNA synthetase
MFQSQELNFLNNRGFLKQLTHSEQLDNLFLKEKITFYIGFDCTADSLHVGHLIPIMIARYLVKMGHQAIIILGTTTAKVGDPSFKNEQRKLIEAETVQKNYESISQIIKKFITSDNPQNQTIFLQNDWLENISLMDFLLNYGSHFSINRMVNIETFAERLNNQKSLSFLEFSYNLLQAYDFVHLSKKYNCTLQIGGSDQWSNIIAGIDLNQKLYPEKNLYGATTNLLLNSSGEKMGKTIGGAVWLKAEKFSPQDYWQYFRNVDDQDILKFFNLLTDLNDNEIQEIEKKIHSAQNSKDLNDLKILLATKITEICHGTDEAKKIESNEKLKFAKNVNFDDLKNISPDIEMQFDAILNLSIIDLLKKITEDEFSGSQIKTLISQNAIKINKTTISDIKFLFTNNSIKQLNIYENLFIIEIGKKKKIIMKISR